MKNEFDREFLKALNLAMTPPVLLMNLMLMRSKTARLRQVSISTAYHNGIKALTEYRARVIEWDAEETLDDAFESFDMFT